jgi:hypothetical protein
VLVEGAPDADLGHETGDQQAIDREGVGAKGHGVAHEIHESLGAGQVGDHRVRQGVDTTLQGSRLLVELDGHPREEATGVGDGVGIEAPGESLEGLLLEVR